MVTPFTLPQGDLINKGKSYIDFNRVHSSTEFLNILVNILHRGF